MNPWKNPKQEQPKHLQKVFAYIGWGMYTVEIYDAESSRWSHVESWMEIPKLPSDPVPLILEDRHLYG